MTRERAGGTARSPGLDLGPHVIVGSRHIDCTFADLLPIERAHVANAVARRRAEFATGRVLARELLAGLGIRNAAIPAGADRAPIWPAGVVGSISHAGGWCAVAVARAGDVRCIGIDLEVDAPLDEDAWEIVLTTREREWLGAFARHERGPLAQRLFAVKEAVYKCQYPITRARLEFQDVDLDARPGGEFGALVRASSTHTLQLSGRTSMHRGLIFAAATATT